MNIPATTPVSTLSTTHKPLAFTFAEETTAGPSVATIDLDGVKLNCYYHYTAKTIGGDYDEIIPAYVEVVEIRSESDDDLTMLLEATRGRDGEPSALEQRIDKLVLAVAEDDSL